MIINTFEELISFIKEKELKPYQAMLLVNKSMNVYFVEDYKTTSEVIQVLTDYWNKYSAYQTKPLFAGLDLNVK